MNLDGFEQRLQRQEMRRVPTEWRREIVAAKPFRGSAESPSRDFGTTRPTNWLRDLLWPSPYAWGAVAATWLVIVGLRLTTPAAVDGDRRAATAPPPAPSIIEEMPLMIGRTAAAEAPPITKPTAPNRSQQPSARQTA